MGLLGKTWGWTLFILFIFFLFVLFIIGRFIVMILPLIIIVGGIILFIYIMVKISRASSASITEAVQRAKENKAFDVETRKKELEIKLLEEQVRSEHLRNEKQNKLLHRRKRKVTS